MNSNSQPPEAKQSAILPKVGVWNMELHVHSIGFQFLKSIIIIIISEEGSLEVIQWYQKEFQLASEYERGQWLEKK